MTPTVDAIVIDVDASKARMNWRRYCSPCLTSSRHNGHWLSHLGRRMTLIEMMSLQAFLPIYATYMLLDAELGKAIGNAMSVNVIQRLLRTLLINKAYLTKTTAD